MKIVKVKPLHVGQFMYARVETDGGIVGWGTCQEFRVRAGG